MTTTVARENLLAVLQGLTQPPSPPAAIEAEAVGDADESLPPRADVPDRLGDLVELVRVAAKIGLVAVGVGLFNLLLLIAVLATKS